MPSLKEDLLAPERRPALVRDCKALVDSEVGRKAGLGGMAIKGAYKALQKIRSGFVEGVIEALLDPWVEQLEPVYAAWHDAGASGAFGDHVTAHKDDVAERLLAVTDARAERTQYSSARKLYKKLRPSAKEHVLEAVPGLARVVDKNLG